MQQSNLRARSRGRGDPTFLVPAWGRTMSSRAAGKSTNFGLGAEVDHVASYSQKVSRRLVGT